MAACGWDFTMVVSEDGEVRAFGRGSEGQLGIGTTAQHLLPAHMGGREVFDTLVVMVVAGTQGLMVATGGQHAAAVVADGLL